MPSQRSGSGSQRRERCPTHGCRTSAVSWPSTRSRRVRPARLVVATPSPTYPPAQARPVPRSSPTDAHQSRGMPSAPPQAWSIRAAADRREQVHQGLPELGEDPGVAVELGPDPRAEVVGRAPAAEDQAVVVGALAVDDQVPVVGEGLAAGQPDLVPGGPGERLGGQHERVDRHHRAALAGEAGRVALGGPHHHLGAHGARGGDRATRARSGARGSARGPAPRAARRRRRAGAPAARDGSPRSRGCTSRRGPGSPAAGPRSRPRRGAPGRRAPGTARARPPPRARRHCGPVRASTTVPPLANGTPRRSATRPTSSTVAHISRCWARAAAGLEPGRRASLSCEAGNSAEHQPPLRPDAPYPATSASSTTMRRVGSASAR